MTPGTPAYRVGLIGAGIGMSLSPSLHEREAAALGVTYEYRLLDLLEEGLRAEDVGEVLARARADGFAAVNVTHPCKQLVMRHLSGLDPDAERLGAVNLVVFAPDGAAHGYNTDWVGFRDALETVVPRGRRGDVLQIGCGGAGAATAYALLASGTARLRLHDADPGRARDLAERMTSLFPAQEVAIADDATATTLSGVDGVVHATPLGMAHHPGTAFDVRMLRSDAWVADVVYRPLDTELVRAARASGRLVVDGGGMAVGQAFASLRIITGLEPDRGRMQRHFVDLIDEETRARRHT
ncbi:shikimate dehydrogenase [Microbacterium sp. NPDC091313]